MTDTRPPRPQALTAACLYLGAIFTVQLVTVLVLVSDLSTAEGQKRVETQLDWFGGGGRSFGDAQTIYQVVLTVVAVLAATGIVCAVHAAKGHHPSRVILTVLAAFFLAVSVSGLLGPGFFVAMLGFLAVFFAAQLWTPVVRSWFRVLAGKAPLPAKAVASTPVPVGAPTGGQSGGEMYPQPGQQPAPPPMPPGYQPYVHTPGREPLPRAVGVAVWTTLIGSIVAMGLSAMFLLSMLVIGDYDSFMAQGGPGADMIRGREADFNEALHLVRVICAIALVLGVGGLFAAIRVLVTRRSGDVVLFVMSVVTIIFTVVIALGFPFGLPWTAAAIVVLVHLRKPESRRWFVKT
ncbi:MAG: hypothetical protein JWQ91_2725 [Aeromicrobium sp.]|jgi:hypothetical protein|uniref:hypothetical protein n=1 Tax=Aeromicrobium sp. TaxID=1871063 RepID=UPI00260D6489|nr:hypothetical protein [Aeromicrobium sp.]MCW2825808.1 hypothetical protein [Aeromicrobium sp.]